MNHKRSVVLVAAGIVVSLIAILAVVSVANESKWSDTLGELTERQRGLTRPVTIVHRPWPKAGEVKGAVLCLWDERDSELRLPKNPNRIWTREGVVGESILVSLDTDGSGAMDVRIVVATADMKSRFFNPVQRLMDTDMDFEDIAKYMPRDQALNKRSDESVMLSALTTVAADYEKAEDVFEASLVYESLMFRRWFELSDDKKLYRHDSKSTRVYTTRGTRDSWFAWYLIVFDTDGVYLGDLLCTEESRDKAFGIAKTMKKTKKAEDP